MRTQLLRGKGARLLAGAVAAFFAVTEQSKALNINSWSGEAGTDAWGTAGNWSDDSVPVSTDQAVDYASNIYLFAAPPSVGSLLISDVGASGDVNTNGFKLNVLGTIAIDGGFLQAGAAPVNSFSIQAPTITLTDSAALFGEAASSNILVSSSSTGTPNGTLSIDGTSALYANGTISAGSIINNGQLETNGTSTVNASTFTLAGTASSPASIYVVTGNTMTINATTFELNNFNTTIDLSSAGATLTLNGTPDYTSGYIGATVDVGASSTLNLGSGGWVFGYYSKSGSSFVSHGNVNLAGGASLASAATIASNATYETNVNVTGYGVLNGPEFDGGSTATVAASSYLYTSTAFFVGTLNSSTITLGGAGVYEMNGATQVGLSGTNIPYTTVIVQPGSTFVWDGTSESTASCSITNGELDIDTNAIDIQYYNHGVRTNHYGYNGALSMTGGASLNVPGTAWTLYGTLAMGPGAVVTGQAVTVNGSFLSPGSYSINPASSGTTFPVITAPLIMDANSYIYMQFNGGIHLDGATTWNGGGVTSAPYIVGQDPYGTLVQDGNAEVSANTTLLCNVLVMDGVSNTTTWTIDPGVTLSQQAFFLDTAGSTTNPFHSTININGGNLNMQTSSGIWTLVGGTINMNQSGGFAADIQSSTLVLGSGSSIGTMNVLGGGLSEVTSTLQSAATTVPGGNILNVEPGGVFVAYGFGSNANAVLTKTGPGPAYIVGAQSHSVGSQIIVSQGSLTFDTDAGAAGANLTINASGGTTVFAITTQLSNLIVQTGATVVLNPVTFPTARLALVTTLNMSGGTLDLADNDLICQNGNLTSIWHNLQTGYNSGAWNGTGGIVSTSAAADTRHLHALGEILNKSTTSQPIYATLDGQASVITDVLVRYTYYGDANLDGKVDGSDYTRIDSAYLADKNNPGALTGWYNGDFNYDGVINGSDYTLIDNSYNTQGAQLAAQLVVPTAEIAASDVAAVPEPAAITILPIAGLGMLRRRRGDQANRQRCVLPHLICSQDGCVS
jgi:hypothetical protein